MIEFDEYKVRLNSIRPKLDALADSLGIEAAKEEIARLHAQIDSEGFWDNQEISQKVMKQSRTLEAKVARYEKMCSQWDDLYTLCEMAIEEGDDSMLPELTEGYAQLEQEMEKARLETLLSGEYDNNNAIVSFQAGAGGTEAQDWASMLYRMYTHWAEQHGLSYKILDYLDGDEAGIKSASILIEGENAYGLLKSENGVHRLVRVSPFDANARRQTSFAAVEVIPEITDDSKDVEIRPRTSRCRSTAPPARAASTSTRQAPPCVSFTSRPASSSPARRSAISSRTARRVCGCCARSSSRSRSVSIWTRSPISRAHSSRSNGAARSATTFSCPIRSSRTRGQASKHPTSTPSWTVRSTASSTPI